VGLIILILAGTVPLYPGVDRATIIALLAIALIILGMAYVIRIFAQKAFRDGGPAHLDSFSARLTTFIVCANALSLSRKKTAEESCLAHGKSLEDKQDRGVCGGTNHDQHIVHKRYGG